MNLLLETDCAYIRRLFILEILCARMKDLANLPGIRLTLVDIEKKRSISFAMTIRYWLLCLG